MTTRVRIVLLAALIAGAVIAMRVVPPGQDAAGRRQPGDPNEAVAILMMLTLPAVALLVFAALRHRPEHRPSALREERKRPSWRGAVLALLALVVLAAGLALLPRNGTREPGKGSRAGNGDRRQADGQPPADAPPTGRGDLDIELWSVFVLVTMLLLLTLSAVVRRKQRIAGPEFDADASQPGLRQQRLAVAVRSALSSVDDAAGDPRSAIIRCYAVLERALVDTPGAEPEPADTPSDVLSRAADAGHIRTESGRRLVDLFTEARYSSHPMTDDDVATAAATLRMILDDLGRQAWVRS